MSFSFDPVFVLVWVGIVVSVVLPTLGTLWAIWKKGDTFRTKLDHSVPIVWNAVQQALRKAGGKLPNGQEPLDFAMGLIKNFVKLTPAQEQMARIALRAYHESQGAPDPLPAKKDTGSALTANH